jgi:hypothetical protein
MNLAPDFADRFNKFLYRQHIRKLGAAEIETAREWCLDLIRREYPHLDEEQRERFYENLIKLQVTAVDEWTRRMT